MKRGFTLLETLISISLFVGISIALWIFVNQSFFFNSYLGTSMNTQLDSRQILKRLVRELRGTSPSSLGSYPIALAGTSSITFYSNIDEDMQKEQIRYFLQGSELRRGETKPSGNPIVYDLGDERLSTIAKNIVNSTSTPIFDYFDKNYAGTSSPLAFPINIADVRLVRITLIIDNNPNNLPLAVTVTTQVNLRNLKDNF